jgi:hypothetical protein
MAIVQALKVDWNNDGDFDDAHDDITSDTLSLSWERGRDYASALIGKTVAGKLTAVLNNTSEKYSPENASSALSGNLLPGRTIRFEAGSGSFPYTFPAVFNDTPHFVGKLERLVPSPQSGKLPTVKIEAFGSLGYLNQFEVQLATETDITTDEAITSILTGVGWPVGDRTLDTGATTMTRFWLSGVKTMEALRIVEDTEAGLVREGKDGKVVFENRNHRLTETTSTTSQATFSDASGADHPYYSITEDDPLSTIINHVEASSRTYTTNSVAVLWTHPETGSDSPTIAPGQTKIFEAVYPNPDAPNNALEVNAWTTSASTTDYLVNTASGGGGTNLTTSMTVANTKLGERMAISITNGSTSDGFITKLQARGTAVVSKNPVIVRAIDTASQAIYGERKYVAKSDFIPSSEEAQGWCDYQMSIFGSPVTILTMTFPGNTDANVGQMLARDISERITVVGTSDAGLGINADFFIESEKHTLSPGKHTVQWELSPASGGYSQFWVLGTSVLGTSTVPAF